MLLPTKLTIQIQTKNLTLLTAPSLRPLCITVNEYSGDLRVINLIRWVLLKLSTKLLFRNQLETLVITQFNLLFRELRSFDLTKIVVSSAYKIVWVLKSSWKIININIKQHRSQDWSLGNTKPYSLPFRQLCSSCKYVEQHDIVHLYLVPKLGMPGTLIFPLYSDSTAWGPLYIFNIVKKKIIKWNVCE
jgi:hypothetical protein